MFVGNSKKRWTPLSTFASLVEEECTQKACKSRNFFHMGLPLRSHFVVVLILLAVLPFTFDLSPLILIEESLYSPCL